VSGVQIAFAVYAAVAVTLTVMAWINSPDVPALSCLWTGLIWPIWASVLLLTLFTPDRKDRS
jgi:hypothetical protein